MICPDLSKSIEELEGEYWGDPDYPSHLVTECHRLRTVPLDQFTAEDLRIMIGQAIGLPFLVPIALRKLFRNPWLSGDCYSGDLLVAVSRIDAAFWQQHPDLRSEMDDVISEVTRFIQLFERDILPVWQMGTRECDG